MDPVLAAAAAATRGFMPHGEGLALYDLAAGLRGGSVIVEIGSYCGKSTVYLGAGARVSGATVVTVDHHRGSEEMQAGWEHHDADLVDGDGRMDSLPALRRTLADTGLDDVVVAVVGESGTVGAVWSTPAAAVFIDGGHGSEPAHRDFDTWSPHVAPGGFMAIHDVFPDPADGGRPPFEIYRRALDGGAFVDHSAVGSLRILRRVS